MKFAHQIMLMFFPIAFIAILGCPKAIRNSALQVINLTEDDFGKKLIIAKGEVFTLTLPNRVDGGYKFDKEQYDSSVLQLEKHIKRSPPANSALGKAGKDVWQFIALKNGKTVLKITVSRPWTRKGIMTEFENEVIVK